MKRAIIIMAKAPIAGTVKTRLQPFLSGEACATLAEAFFRDAVNKTKDLNNQLIIAFAPADQRDFFAPFTNCKIILEPQSGGDLGEKMRSAFKFAFDQNFASVVMIGTDSPTLPPELVERAFEILETGASEIVIGKTTDGGFYLIGMRALRTEIFENVEWSSPETFFQTKENVLRLKLNLAEIPVWYDIDEPADLQRLLEEFEQNKRARKIALQTFAWSKQL